MKQQYKDMLIPIIALMLICLGMTALMAYTYNLTLPAVEANEAQSGDYAGEIFPGVTFTDVTVEGALEAKKADSGEKIIVMQAIGYNKGVPMQVAVGFAPDGTVAAIRFLKIEETQGVGTQVLEEPFFSSFNGQTDGESVDAIGGATFSSKAVKKAVTDAAELAKGV